MKLTGLVVFAAGYIVGARAGRERYEEIRALAQRVADRLEEHAVEAGLGPSEPPPLL